jgi:hypothetical protein
MFIERYKIHVDHINRAKKIKQMGLTVPVKQLHREKIKELDKVEWKWMGILFFELMVYFTLWSLSGRF